MQHIGKQPAVGTPAVAVPKLPSIPWKKIASGLAGILIFLLVIGITAYIASSSRYDDTELRGYVTAGFQDLNDSKASRNGTIYQLEQKDLQISNLSNNLGEANKKISEQDIKINSLTTSLSDTKTQLITLQTLSSKLQESLTEIRDKLNSTTPATAPVQNITVDNRSCRQKILDLHGLGPGFDIVYCCESRSYGFADECCACYR